MDSNKNAEHTVQKLMSETLCHDADGLTPLEIAEIAMYTIQKINNYPKLYGKTVENYFHLLFPDEVKDYLMAKTINKKTLSSNETRVKEIRTLFQLLLNQQDVYLRQISDKLDELEADLSRSDAGGEEIPNGEQEG